jgi:hypothetical protein
MVLSRGEQVQKYKHRAMPWEMDGKMWAAVTGPVDIGQ